VNERERERFEQIDSAEDHTLQAGHCDTRAKFNFVYVSLSLSLSLSFSLPPSPSLFQCIGKFALFEYVAQQQLERVSSTSQAHDPRFHVELRY
jgi:hypothetical protein